MPHLDEKREAVAISTLQVKLTKINEGPDIYSALIYIAGHHFGSVTQRRGGKYQAYSKTNRFLGEADSLSQLRDVVVRAYADAGGEDAPSSRPPAVA